MTDNSKQNNNQNQEKKIYKEAIDKIIKSIQKQGMKLEQYFNITTSTNNKTTITNKGYAMEVIQDFVMNNAELAEYYNMFGILEFEGMLEGALKKIVYKEVEEKNQEQIKGNIKNFMEHFNEDETEDNQNQQQPKQNQINITGIQVVNRQKKENNVNELKLNKVEIRPYQTQQQNQTQNLAQKQQQTPNNSILHEVEVVNSGISNSSCLFFDKDGRVVENVISDKDKKKIETIINSNIKNTEDNKNPFEVDKDTTDYIKKQMGARGATDGAMAVVSNTGNPANPNEKQLNILMIGNPDIKVILHVTNGKGQKVDWEMTINEDNNYTIIDENGEEIDPDTLTNIKIPGIHREKSVEMQQEQTQGQEEQKQEEPTVQENKGENTPKAELDNKGKIAAFEEVKKVDGETQTNSSYVKQLKSKNGNINSNNEQSSGNTYHFG